MKLCWGVAQQLPRVTCDYLAPNFVWFHRLRDTDVRVSSGASLDQPLHAYGLLDCIRTQSPTCGHTDSW